MGIPYIDTEARGVLEFDVSDMDSGSTVQSGMLEVLVNSWTSNSKQLEVYGYVGNGSVDLDDAIQTATLIGTSPVITQLGTLAISLDSDWLESIAGADYLGLLVKQKEAGNISFYANDWYSMAPSLTIDYTPAPIAGDANKDGRVDGSDVTILAGKLAGFKWCYVGDGRFQWRLSRRRFRCNDPCRQLAGRRHFRCLRRS